MNAVDRIRHLVDLAAPCWAGEAEVVRTYWASPVRTRETDMLWLSRQCFNEFWGSGVSHYDRGGGVFIGVLKKLLDRAPEIDLTLDRREVLGVVEGLHAEFAHYCAFADVYDELRPTGTPKLNPQMLKVWPENAAFVKMRYRHQEEHGAIGMRACKFTEGGYCTLFFEGMRLKGKGGIEDKIAAACARVYDDEFEHMLAGIAGIAEENMTESDWRLFEKLVVEQLQHRIRMRNEQFSHPVSEERVQAIYRGEIEPLSFDFKKARLAA